MVLTCSIHQREQSGSKGNLLFSTELGGCWLVSSEIRAECCISIFSFIKIYFNLLFCLLEQTDYLNFFPCCCSLVKYSSFCVGSIWCAEISAKGHFVLAFFWLEMTSSHLGLFDTGKLECMSCGKTDFIFFNLILGSSISF